MLVERQVEIEQKNKEKHFGGLEKQMQGKYSLLLLRWTCSGQAPTVHLSEVSTLEGDEVNDLCTEGTNSMCPL